MQDSNDSHYQHGQKQTCMNKTEKTRPTPKKKKELKSDPAVKNML